MVKISLKSDLGWCYCLVVGLGQGDSHAKSDWDGGGRR